MPAKLEIHRVRGITSKVVRHSDGSPNQFDVIRTSIWYEEDDGSQATVEVTCFLDKRQTAFSIEGLGISGVSPQLTAPDPVPVGGETDEN